MQPLQVLAMIRNVIVGLFFAPLGALLPIALLALLAALVAAPFSGNPFLVLSTVVVQLGYGLFAVYFFGGVAALLIGVGNAIVWRFTPSIRRRLLLAPLVGIAAVSACFGSMLFGVGGFVSALPSFALFCVAGAVAATFAAFLVALDDVSSDTDPVPA